MCAGKPGLMFALCRVCTRVSDIFITGMTTLNPIRATVVEWLSGPFESPYREGG